MKNRDEALARDLQGLLREYMATLDVQASVGIDLDMETVACIEGVVGAALVSGWTQMLHFSHSSFLKQLTTKSELLAAVDKLAIENGYVRTLE